MKFINRHSKPSVKNPLIARCGTSPNRKGEGNIRKSKMTRSPFMGFVSAAALLGLLAAWNPEAGLAQSCSPGMGGSIGVSGPYATPLDFYIHVGQSATIKQLATINTGSCTLTNLKACYENMKINFVTAVCAPGHLAGLTSRAGIHHAQLQRRQQFVPMPVCLKTLQGVWKLDVLGMALESSKGGVCGNSACRQCVLVFGHCLVLGLDTGISNAVIVNGCRYNSQSQRGFVIILI